MSDFIEVCEELGIPYEEENHEHCRPGWIQLDCPYCSPDWQRFRMGYNLAGKYVTCWACGFHGLADTLMRITNLGYEKIKPLLDDLPSLFETERIERGKLELPKGISELESKHKKYLTGRGFNPEKLVKLWGIQGLGKFVPKLRNRIFIPITYRGKTVSWTTRSIFDDHEGRYRSAAPNQESINHKELLYGEDYVRNAVLVVEGPTDVWRIGPGCVCTFGTGFSAAQVARLASRWLKVVCFDDERFAKARAQDLCNQLAMFPGETYMIELHAHDPGSASEKVIRKIRKKFLDPYYGVLAA